MLYIIVIITIRKANMNRSKIMKRAHSLRDQENLSWGEAQKRAWAEAKATKSVGANVTQTANNDVNAAYIAIANGFSASLCWGNDRKARFGYLVKLRGAEFAQKALKKGWANAFLSGRSAEVPAPVRKNLVFLV
jgi:hypothetical protein